MANRGAITAVASLELFKGILALAAASGLLLLVHQDLNDLALRIVEHLHLNPAAHVPHVFLLAAADLQNTRLVLVAAGAAAYSTLRFVESYGLWREAAWAEVLAAASGGIYLPAELVELARGASWIGVAVLLLNLVIVAVMVQALLERRRRPARRDA